MSPVGVAGRTHSKCRSEMTEMAPILVPVSAAVLRAHLAKKPAGAVVASLSTPWGEAQTPGTSMYRGGYHLVWPRDQVQVAGGLVAVGAVRLARDVLDNLLETQQADGHWPQNMWTDGEKYWGSIQLGETALPVLLAGRLVRAGAVTREESLGYVAEDSPGRELHRAQWTLDLGGPVGKQARLHAVHTRRRRQFSRGRCRNGGCGTRTRCRGLSRPDRRRLECRHRRLAIR